MCGRAKSSHSRGTPPKVYGRTPVLVEPGQPHLCTARHQTPSRLSTAPNFPHDSGATNGTFPGMNVTRRPTPTAPLTAVAAPIHASPIQAARLTAAVAAVLFVLLPLLSPPAAYAQQAPPTAAPPTADQPAPPGDEAGWPLRPRPQLVHGFEPPPKPWLPGHRGVDLAGSPGQPILSATPGTITYAGQLAGRGVIAVTHGQLRTTYEPVIPSAKVGTSVRPGQQLGHLSAAGSHCSPATCLHWGLLKGKTYLDPLSLLPSHPVRLLPLTDTPPTKTRLSDNPATSTKDPRDSAQISPKRLSDNAAASTSGLSDNAAAGTMGLPDRPPASGTGSRNSSSATTTVDGGGDPAGLLSGSHGGGRAAGIVVALAAIITIGSALMISRH